MEQIKKLFKKYEQVIMYIIMGGCTTVVYYIVRFGSRLIMGDGVNQAAMIATALAQITAITFAYITNKKFVFKKKTDSIGELIKEAIAFYGGRGVTFLLDMLITFIFIEKFADTFISLFALDKIDYTSGLIANESINKLMGSPEKLNEFIWSMFSQVIILVLNYVFSKLIVFKKK